MFKLSSSPWPRTGRTRANSALAPFPGPDSATLLLRANIRHSGVVVSTEGGGFLIAGDRDPESPLTRVNAAGEVLWTRTHPGSWSAPAAMADGSAVLTSVNHVVRVTAEGELQVTETRYQFDDSRVSPNVTEGGELVLSTMHGEILVGTPDALRELGPFGYDVLPPAIDGQGRLAFSGYYSTGPTRLSLEGEPAWTRPTMLEAEGLTVLNQHGESTVHELEAGCTHGLDAQGETLFRLSEVALCAEHPLGWAALGEGKLLLISRNGEVHWSRDIDNELDWGSGQPAVDSRGVIYVPCLGGVVAWSAGGELLWQHTDRQAQPSNLALVGPGQIAFALHRQLIVLGEG